MQKKMILLRWFPFAALIAFVLAASTSLRWTSADGPPAAGADAAAPAKVAEYAKKVATVDPRDAEGFYQLGLWCQERGLQDQAVKAFERAVRIDPDHPQARVALGYRALGTEWTKGSPKPRRSAEGDETPPPKPRRSQAREGRGTREEGDAGRDAGREGRAEGEAG